MTPEPARACPYGELCIYHLSGRLARDLEPDLGPGFLGNWVEEDTSFLFFSGPADEAVGRATALGGNVTVLDRFFTTWDQWQGGDVEPFSAGPLYVHPPWNPGNPPLGSLALSLDPGMVFGTGTHPTTRDCLSALYLAMSESPARRVLDLGTGTGLLALAAARLGAREILAVDLNPLAADTARKNVRDNGLESRVTVVHGSAEAHAGRPWDLVVANIHFAVMKRLLETPAFSKSETLILSGLLRSEVREIRHLLNRLGVAPVREWDWENTWFTLLARKREPFTERP